MASALAELMELKARYAEPIAAEVRRRASNGATKEELKSVLDALPTAEKRGLEKELRREAKKPIHQQQMAARAAKQGKGGKPPKVAQASGNGQAVRGRTAIAPSTASSAAPNAPRDASSPYDTPYDKPPDATAAAAIGDDISDDDLGRCIAVLNRLAADMSQLSAPRFRPLRKALEPAHAAMSERDAATLAYGRQRQLRKEEEARKAHRAAMDAKHLDTTGLRKGRIHRLKELCEQNDGGAGGRLAIGMAGDLGTIVDGRRRRGEGEDGEEEGEEGRIKYLCQAPDGAVREDMESYELSAMLPRTVDGDDSGRGSHAHEGVATASSSTVSLSPSKSIICSSVDAPAELFKSRQCYTCKARFHTLHHFYASLCPKCAALNFRMRHLTADLRGRVALLTGSRVKIGFEIGLKLLRAGATLIATTRFPADAAARYAAMPDFAQWRDRLQLHAVDLRDVAALEGFCDFLTATLPRLDIVVNNACQTVRRPASYYAHLVEAEAEMEAAVKRHAAQAARRRLMTVGEEKETGADAQVQPPVPVVPPSDGTVAPDGAEQRASAQAELLPLFTQQGSRSQWSPASASITWVGDTCDDGGSGGESNGSRSNTNALLGGTASSVSPAQLSQLKVAPEDHLTGETRSAYLPEGRLDVNGQQIDLRRTNSWLLKLNDVSTPELVEVFAINTLAPFLLNARLQPLLAATAASGAPRTECGTAGRDTWVNAGAGAGASASAEPRGASVASGEGGVPLRPERYSSSTSLPWRASSTATRLPTTRTRIWPRRLST